MYCDADMHELALLLIPIAPLTAAVLAVLWGRRANRIATIGSAISAAAGIVVMASVVWSGPFTVGSSAGLVADRIGTVLAILTGGVGTVVMSFARRALDGDPRAPRFFGYSSLLVAGTALTAVAASFTGLTIGWVTTGWALLGLLTHREWSQAHNALQATRRTFLIGDLALVLAAGAVLGRVGEVPLQSVDASVIPQIVPFLIVAAAISRSALIPAHRWLVTTIAAPTPVSALLHAGVVNAAGVLIVKTAPVSTASGAAMAVLFGVAAATTLLGTAIMLMRSDVKGGLAWSTVGQMGFMGVQLAVGALAGALFHLVGHAMYKASLFLGSGGAITAMERRRHLPRPDTTASRPTRVFLAGIGAALGVAVGFSVIDPHLDPAGTVLVAAFGWFTTMRLVDGWLSAMVPSSATLALASVAAVGLPLAYVGGIGAFEALLAPSLPTEVPGAIPATVLGGALVVAALAILVVRMLPGRVGDHIRGRAFTWLATHGDPGTHVAGQARPNARTEGRRSLDAVAGEAR